MFKSCSSIVIHTTKQLTSILLSGREMDPVLTVTAVSILLGSLIAFAFFANYFGKRKSEVQSIAKSELQPDPKKQNKPSQSKKSHLKAHSHSHAVKVEIRSLYFSVWLPRKIRGGKLGIREKKKMSNPILCSYC